MQKVTRCDQCGAEIIWATHNSTQKRAPLDARPVRSNYGNIDLDKTRSTYVVLDTEVAEAAWARGFELYTNHLGTCPARESTRQQAANHQQETERI